MWKNSGMSGCKTVEDNRRKLEFEMNENASRIWGEDRTFIKKK